MNNLVDSGLSMDLLLVAAGPAADDAFAWVEATKEQKQSDALLAWPKIDKIRL